MQAGSDTLAAVANHWLARFEHALGAGDAAALAALFRADSHWRDVLAFSWRIRTLSGAQAIATQLTLEAPRVRASCLRTDPARTAPRHATRAGAKCVEAIFRFETAAGRGSGLLRFLAESNDDPPRAWTLLTTLEELRGHEERVGPRRPTGQSYSRDFSGPNWLDLRRASLAYKDRDPAALIVGGGQAGLSIGARLKALGVDALIVDRWPRAGDNWRRRYHALTLHNQVHVNHLPYLPFPPTWPVYIPKDMLASWFEAYVEALELNYWTGTELTGGRFDDREQRWSVTLKQHDGTVREMQPRHVILATGVSGIPNLPHIPSLSSFRGTVLHSSAYTDGEAWRGKRALVIGTGNSGHDITQDLHSRGATVTLAQRSPTLIVNIEPSAQLVYGLYSEGPPLEDCDLITASVPLALARKSHQLATAHARDLDRPLLEQLERKGFRLDFGEDDTGWQFKYLTRGGGYYFNVGCSDLLVEGKVRLLQFGDIARFVADGAQLTSGEQVPADLIVLATGYKGQEALVEKLFGAEIAQRVGPVWGFGDGEELRNMFQRTPQSGLWFIAGSFAQCRIYSKYLALQIKAAEAGLIH
ncbi:MAG TPA: NAD(P)/FAD-dependent oxidoreductase [Burkholderiales bacterium]|nr:NAD(P)/FAD-dependent oxidoreductase [Burkholderiales bacterium]